jgi:general secretion pathway protein G
MGDYPPQLEALRYQQNDAGAGGQWSGPYIDSDIPMDPWRQPYRYKYPGQHDPDFPDVWSAGPDRADGTDDDVTSWGPN